MEKNKNISSNKKNTKNDFDFQIIIFLKLLIVFTILLVPLSFMIIDISNNFYNLSKNSQNINENTGQENDEDFNFQASLPSEKIGDITNVSEEKMDSLFNNLKK